MTSDPDPTATQEWLDALDSVAGVRGRRAGDVPARRAARAGPRGTPCRSVLGDHPVRQHHPGRRAARRTPGDRELEHRIRSLNRWNAVATVLRANKESLGAGRAHRVVPVVGHAVRHGLQPLLARAPATAHGGDLLFVQGHVVPGHLRAGVPRGPAHRGAAAQLPPGGGRRRAVVVPAPVADARLLAVPHGVDGSRPADGDLPGPVPQVPGRPRAGRHRRTGTCGRSSATARWTSPSRWARSRWPAGRSSTT